MIMGLPLRCRYLSVLQVVAIVVCYGGKASSVMVEGCVESQLSLICEGMKVINITTVVLGDYNGIIPRFGCDIRDNDCTRNATENITMDVHRRCDGQSNCTVDVIQETISCGFTPSKSDFERITYDCIDDPRSDTMNSTADNMSTEVTSDSGSDDNNDEKTTKKTDNSEALPIAMVIIGLIILLAIVVFVVVMYRRKKRAQVKLFNPVAMTEVDNRQNESEINANQTQGISLHDNNVPLSLYSLTDEADFPRADEDPVVYSDVELRETAWNDGQSDCLSADKAKTATEAHTAGPDVYVAVNNPATSSAIKTDLVGVKSLVDNGDCFRDHIYTLASNDMEDIYANETSTQVVAEAVSKTPSPEDDGGLTVIENDLYCH